MILRSFLNIVFHNLKIKYILKAFYERFIFGNIEEAQIENKQKKGNRFSIIHGLGLVIALGYPSPSIISKAPY